MNKNKLIFGIIGVVILALIIFGILSLKTKTDDSKDQTGRNTFDIWVLGDTQSGFSTFLQEFKLLKPAYKTMNFKVESFSNYEEYHLALISAITKGKAPDIFVLNNGEKESIFADQILGIDSSVISPNDFRKKYKGVFGDDLILTNTDSEGKQQEFLAGIPIGYETLGIFYNRRYLKSNDFASLSSLNNIVLKLKDKYPNLIPIGIGNGSTVYGVSDIITQFFMLESGVTKLSDISGNKLKQSLASYLLFGDNSGVNKYNSRFIELQTLGQNNLDLFAKGEVFMVVGYPRLLQKIDQNGFSKNFLRAEPFPHYYSGEGKTLLNYNYFVINKDTQNYSLASELLSYMTTDSGASNYLSQFPYYLPALLSLESDKLEEKVDTRYSIVLESFYNPDFELGSFDRGIKNIYDRNIVSILDNSANYETAFIRFKSDILCKTKKLISLQSLSSKCE